MFKGLHGLTHFIVELKHITTPTKLLARPGVVGVTIYIYIRFTPVCFLWNIYIFIYALLVFYSCFTSLDICNYHNPPSLTYIHLHSCFTRTLLVLFLVRVCVPTYWLCRECGWKWGAEERWSMGAWRVAAEGSWWSTATRTASCLSTHPSRCCAGKYSSPDMTACSSSCPLGSYRYSGAACYYCDPGEMQGSWSLDATVVNPDSLVRARAFN